MKKKKIWKPKRAEYLCKCKKAYTVNYSKYELSTKSKNDTVGYWIGTFYYGWKTIEMSDFDPDNDWKR